MKQLFLFGAALFFCVICPAQQYKVYSVVGTVTANDQQIQRGMLITMNCHMSFSKNSKIIILDESAKEMITLSTSVSGQLKDLIAANQNRKKLSESYFQYILKKMTEDDSPRDKNVMQSTAASYREGDTLVLQKLFPSDSIMDTIIK